jgi:hypothetical protein
VQAQRVAHQFRHHHVALDLLDAEEEERDPERRDRVHDERVDDRRNRAEPRPEVRDHLGQRTHAPNSSAYRCPLDSADGPGAWKPTRARADDQAQRHPPRTYETRADSTLKINARLPGRGGKRRSIRRPSRTGRRHVDRDALRTIASNSVADPDPRPFDEVDDAVRYFADVNAAGSASRAYGLASRSERRHVDVIQPVLQPVDVLVCLVCPD